MNILDISPLGIYPPIGGAAARIHNINSRMSVRGARIFLFSQGIRYFELRFPLKSWISKINESYTEYRYINYPSLATAYIMSSLRVHHIFSGDILRLTRPNILLSEIQKADIIKVEFPWQFRFAFENKLKNTRIVLVAHDVEYDLLSHVIHAPSALTKVLKRATFSREKFAVENADMIFTVSEEDAERLKELYRVKKDKLLVSPNGADVKKFCASTWQQRKHAKEKLGLLGKRVILFTGSKHPPNVQAVAEIFKMSEKVVDENIVFLVVGSVGVNFRNTKKVIITGRVNDVLPYFEAADIGINPMLSGGGTNVKMLEYLAYQMPTITTPLGARGLMIAHNRHAVIAEIQDFHNSIHDLLADGAKQRRLGRDGRRLVEEKYDWAKIADNELQLLERFTD